MKFIRSATDYEAFYAYAPRYKPNRYPRSYPCVVRKEDEDAGIMGSQWVHYVAYPPEDYDELLEVGSIEAWMAGLTTKWEVV